MIILNENNFLCPVVMKIHFPLVKINNTQILLLNYCLSNKNVQLNTEIGYDAFCSHNTFADDFNYLKEKSIEEFYFRGYPDIYK